MCCPLIIHLAYCMCVLLGVVVGVAMMLHLEEQQYACNDGIAKRSVAAPYFFGSRGLEFFRCTNV